MLSDELNTPSDDLSTIKSIALQRMVNQIAEQIAALLTARNCKAQTSRKRSRSL